MSKLIQCTTGAIILLISQAISAQNPFTGIEFGASADQVKAAGKDVSNPQSWDETEFEISKPPYLLLQQFKPSLCRLIFFKNRLYSMRCELQRHKFEAIYTNFVAQKQVPKNKELLKKDKSATWYGAFQDGRFSDVLNVYQSGEITHVMYSDESQKDFRFGDLFRGMTPWLILTLVGLFAGYLVFGWLMTSKCPKCKTRKLKVTGKSYDNPKDYDPGIFSRDVHWDQVYHYKCAHCGFEKDDTYSSFWSWYRSRD